MLLTGVSRATAARCMPAAYTAAEAGAAATVNAAYAPTLAALPHPSTITNRRTIEALATYYSPPATTSNGATIAEIGLPPSGGVRPRVALNPATGRIEILPFSGDAMTSMLNSSTSATYATASACHAPAAGEAPSFLHSVYGIFSRTTTAKPPSAIFVAVAPLSISAAAPALADRRADEPPSAASGDASQPADDTSALRTHDASLTTNLIPKRLEDTPQSLRMSPTESCIPLWRTLLLNERDPNLNYIAWNGGAYA